LLVDTKNKTITDAYIFDNIAAVKVQGFFFVFFKKPLTLASYSTFLTPTNSSAPGDASILAWDFR
jgi:hypothetical protein